MGWRPGGAHSGQAKAFVDRFPQEFNIQSLQKIVLPMREGVPYVCPDGTLPCPWLATRLALKQLHDKPPKAGDPRALADMALVQSAGVVVEWKEFATYMHFMVSCEGAAIQADVMLKPHVVDTALMWVQYLQSREAAPPCARGDTAAAPGALEAPRVLTGDLAKAPAPGPRPQTAEEGFNAFMQGKSHRLRDARTLLRSTLPEVVMEIYPMAEESLLPVCKCPAAELLPHGRLGCSQECGGPHR